MVKALRVWMRAEYARVSTKSQIGKALAYMLKRWDAFARFLGDGRICLTNNAAERALRGVALGRKAWLFCGSDRGGERVAMMYALIQSANSTTSIHKPGLPMWSPASPITPTPISTRCCHGTGGQRILPSATRPDQPHSPAVLGGWVPTLDTRCRYHRKRR
jgi:hypothetical protein